MVKLFNYLVCKAVNHINRGEHSPSQSKLLPAQVQTERKTYGEKTMMQPKGH